MLKFFKSIFCTVALALAIALPAGSLLAQDSQKTLINGIDADFKNFAYVELGEAKGFDIDMINWIAEKKGLKVVHQAVPWAAIITTLKENKIDLIASGLSYSEERAEQVSFTKPYWTIKQVILVKNDSDLTVEQVLTGGKTIGVQSGTTDMSAMEEHQGQEGRNYTLKGYTSALLAVEDMVNGRVDAAVMNNSKADEFLPIKPVKLLGLAGIPEENFAIAVNKDNPELLATLNEGLDLIMSDPYWKELIDKWEIDK
ncbi:MAG: ABC transporter substrate-binding protein [Deltaproteobacteria bacterium]|jgi:polar amino acid transport system substrate-binding protein|nr:ABC transporter substrate-binding protein [Deltaproteobacteria bacterium]